LEYGHIAGFVRLCGLARRFVHGEQEGIVVQNLHF